MQKATALAQASRSAQWKHGRDMAGWILRLFSPSLSVTSGLIPLPPPPNRPHLQASSSPSSFPSILAPFLAFILRPFYPPPTHPSLSCVQRGIPPCSFGGHVDQSIHRLPGVAPLRWDSIFVRCLIVGRPCGQFCIAINDLHWEGRIGRSGEDGNVNGEDQETVHPPRAGQSFPYFLTTVRPSDSVFPGPNNANFT
jgi:hypothetical protein